MKQTHIRSLALAAVMAAVALVMPRTMRAQEALNCRCDSINVINNSNCKARICYLTAVSGCHDFGPGTTGKIPCINGGSVTIRDCNGVFHNITSACENLALSPGCCVRVCLIQAAAGCYTITINPSPILCLCP